MSKWERAAVAAANIHISINSRNSYAFFCCYAVMSLIFIYCISIYEYIYTQTKFLAKMTMTMMTICGEMVKENNRWMKRCKGGWVNKGRKRCDICVCESLNQWVAVWRIGDDILRFVDYIPRLSFLTPTHLFIFAVLILLLLLFLLWLFIIRVCVDVDITYARRKLQRYSNEDEKIPITAQYTHQKHSCMPHAF